MRLRLTIAATGGVALLAALPSSTNISLRLPGRAAVVSAQAATDCCLPLPVVATSRDPAKGSVHNELRLTDLEALFSNRHLMFAGGWDDAFTALAYELDPSGKYNLRERPLPPVVRQVALVEGGYSHELLHSPPTGPSSGPQPNRTSTSPWAGVRGEPSVIVDGLLNTLARINKYGEPAVGLRAAALASARFLIDGLAAIPVEVQRQDPNALRLRAVSASARVTLYGYLLSPDILSRGRRPPHKPTELELTDIDITNAALDVLGFVDESGRRYGMFTLREQDTEEDPVFQRLIDLASASSRFGGTAAPGSPLESVACRAFSTLVDLADVHTRGGARRLRDDLLRT